MSNQSLKNLVIEGARLSFKNFSGKEGRFNPPGCRNFCVIFDEEIGNKLKEDGWNINYLHPKEEGDPVIPYLKVAVNFDNYPPRCVLISSKGKTYLDENDINILDWAEIKNVDLVVRPYTWSVAGKTGVKAFLKSLYVTISEDELEAKYLDIPDSAANSFAE